MATKNYGWKEIDNDATINITVDVNTPLEEIDETLKQVSDVADAAQSLATTNEGDIATLDAQMAGTSGSGLKDLIEENMLKLYYQGPVSAHADSEEFQISTNAESNVTNLAIKIENLTGPVLNNANDNVAFLYTLVPMLQEGSTFDILTSFDYKIEHRYTAYEVTAGETTPYGAPATLNATIGVRITGPESSGGSNASLSSNYKLRAYIIAVGTPAQPSLS